MTRSLEARQNGQPREKTASEIILALQEPLRSQKLAWYSQERRKGVSEREIKEKLAKQLAKVKKK